MNRLALMSVNLTFDTNPEGLTNAYGDFGDLIVKADKETGTYTCRIHLDNQDDAVTLRRINARARADGYILVEPGADRPYPWFALRSCTMAEAIEEAAALLRSVNLQESYRQFWHHTHSQDPQDAYELSIQLYSEPDRHVVIEPHFEGDVNAYAQAITASRLAEQVTLDYKATSAWGATVHLTLTPAAAANMVETCLTLANLHPALQ